MKKTFKKGAGLALAVLMAVTAAGCGKKNGEAMEPDTDERLDIDFMISGQGTDDSHFVLKKTLDEKFNINANFLISASSAHIDKLKILITSDSLPDIVSPFPNDLAKNCGPRGALVPLSDYLDKMPNYKKYLTSNAESYASQMANDDKVYVAALYREQSDCRYVPILRRDLFEEQGIEIPKTYNELYTALKKIKEKHPEIIGLVNKVQMACLSDYGMNFNTSSEMFYNKEKDKWEYGPVNKGFKEMLTFFNNLWKEGLMDPEFFTASTKQWEEKILSGKAVFTLGWVNDSYDYKKTYLELHPNSKFDLSLTEPMTTESYDVPVIQTSAQINDYCAYGISAKSPAAARLLKVVDFMYSDEGSTLAQYGVEGKNFTTTEDGKKKYAEDIMWGYNPKGTHNPLTYYGLRSDHLMRVVKAQDYEKYADIEMDAINMRQKYWDNNWGYTSNNGIKLTFTEDQQAEIDKIKNNLSTMVNEESIKFIVGERPMSEFDSFIAQLEKLNYKKLENIYSEAFKQYKDRIKMIKLYD